MKKLAMLLSFVMLIAMMGCSQSAANEPKTDHAAAEQKKEGTQKSDYPNKPIRMIVPYAAGGPTDLAARVIAEAMGKYLGQSVVIENKPGGASTIGLTELYNAKPDGYTIAMATTGATSVQPHFGKAVYTHDSFQAVAQILDQSHYFVVRADSPWKTFDEWLDYVKKNPDTFTYSTAGTGNSGHLIMEALSAAAGVKLKHVPFDGSAPAVTALIGGHVMGTSCQLSDIKAYIESGEVRILANSGHIKNKGFEEVPFYTEKGLDVDISIVTGILAPKGIPQDVLETLHAAAKKATEDPQVLEKYEKLSIEPAYAGPDDFQKTISDDFKQNGEILKMIGMIQ